MKKTTINALVKAIEDNFANVKKLGEHVATIKSAGDWKNDNSDIKQFKDWLNEYIIPKCNKLSASTLDAYANAWTYIWSVDGCEDLPLYKAQALVRSAKHDPKKFCKGVKSGAIDITNNNRAELKEQAEKCVGLSGSTKTSREEINGCDFSIKSGLKAVIKNCEVAIEHKDRDTFNEQWSELKKLVNMINE